jgi:hypothetical protein
MQRHGAAEGAKAGRGAERGLPVGAATAHLPWKNGAVRTPGAAQSMRREACGLCRRCAVERARSARALSPGPPPPDSSADFGPLRELPPVASSVPTGLRIKKARSAGG